ncbi:MAG: putative addiction module antidote protein [Chromatium okenii]|nr:putative addiction module antidote protein [Chromatium okenii]
METEEDIRLYLDACIAEDPGDGTLICQALSAIARRRNLSSLAGDGINHEGLNKALSANGNPSFALILKIAHALNLELQLVTMR